MLHRRRPGLRTRGVQRDVLHRLITVRSGSRRRAEPRAAHHGSLQSVPRRLGATRAQRARITPWRPRRRPRDSPRGHRQPSETATNCHTASGTANRGFFPEGCAWIAHGLGHLTLQFVLLPQASRPSAQSVHDGRSRGGATGGMAVRGRSGRDRCPNRYGSRQRNTRACPHRKHHSSGWRPQCRSRAAQ